MREPRRSAPKSLSGFADGLLLEKVPLEWTLVALS
jgi:hypothetical protein